MKRLVFLIALVTYVQAAFASDADLLYFSGGIFGLRKQKYRTGEFRIDYKSHKQWMKFRPTLGVMGTLKKSFYACAGVSWDWVFGPLVFAPNFAAGYYYKGDGKDLGYPLEFRSGIELGVRFSSAARMGINFTHISNASLGKKNPGVESFVFFLALPLNAPSKKTKKNN